MADLMRVTSNVSETVQLLGIIRSAFDAASLTNIHEAIQRPTPGPMGRPVMRQGHDLETAIATRFAQEGQDPYGDGRWQGYQTEPKYEEYKRNRDGGGKVGTWEGSRNPLSQTFKKGHPEHETTANPAGFTFASRRAYAGRFHAGAPVQPFDGGPQPARKIFPSGNRLGVEVARAYQNQIEQLVRSRGSSLRSVRVTL